jgi:glycoprotein endo-alpha-1,2-mannosidase
MIQTRSPQHSLVPFMIGTYFALLLSFFFLCPKLFGQPLGYETKIVFSSTSDWASLEIMNSSETMFLDLDIIEDRSGSATVNCHGIFREDTALVTVEYLLFSQSIPDEGFIIRSQKGDWGIVTFIFINANSEPSESVYTFTNPGSIHGDPTNTRTFTVPSNLLTENGPIPLKGTPLSIPKKVCAFYYPWYGNPKGPTGYWFHWDPYNHYASTDTPLLRYYDSLSDTVVQQHMEWAQEYGIDVFISSWWGIDSFEDTALELILETALEYGIEITVYLEASGTAQNASEEKRPDIFAGELNHILETYGHHPAFFKQDGIPVIFVYGFPLGLISLENWEDVFHQVTSEALFIADTFDPEALNIFDGCHTYNPVTLSEEDTDRMYWTASIQAYYYGKIFAATVVPGYDDRIIRYPGIYVPRENGAFYESRWNVATSNSPHWILITSWNEWHEGTEIEPSLEYGFAYLDSTKAYRDEWIMIGGDVNGDGAIDIIDVIAVINFILQINIPTQEELESADMNGDGTLNVLDVIRIVNMILG